MIKLRAHHLLCIPRFKGGSYDKKSKERFFEIQEKIKKNPNLVFKIIRNVDYGCMACPHMKNKKCMKTPESNKAIKRLDLKVLKELKIKENSIHKARKIFKLSISKIKNRELNKICRNCEYLKYCLKHGFNKSFIKLIK